MESWTTAPPLGSEMKTALLVFSTFHPGGRSNWKRKSG